MKNFHALIEIVNKLRVILTKKQKQTGILVLIVIIVGSFLETLGVSAILPFIESLLNPENVKTKWYAKALINVFGIDDTKTLTILIGISIIAIYVIKNLYLYFATMLHTIYRSKIEKYLSTKMLAAYMKWPYERFIDINTAEVIRGIGTDIIGVYNLLDEMFRFVGEFFTAILIGLFIIYTDSFMAICIILIAGACFALITLGLKKRTSDLSEEKRRTDTIRGKSAYQAIMGFKEIKVSNTADHFIVDYEKAYEDQRRAEVNNQYIVNLPERVIESLSIAVLMGVICAKLVMGADMTTFVPKLAVFAVAAFRLLPSVSRMTRYMNGIIYNNNFLKAAYGNLLMLGDCGEEYVSYAQSCNKNKENAEFKDSLTINNIHWHYKNSDKKILSGLSLKIKKGESIGLMGSSGAGKSTLADIMLGLLKPQEGDVFMDDMDVFDHPEAWSEVVAYVPQSIFLLDDSIRRNVAFGYSDDEIDDDKVWAVLKEAQLDEYIKTLPDGLDTQVGERGIKFSGGQRQRIAIARTLYRNPEIIVLDEATSALDGETETAVMEAVDALQGQKTLIIVAHRLSTIKNCNRIYEIGNGVATERRWEDINPDKK
ncbi:ABC transporter ATP-binding protein [Butyrivibrio proteoclasticus]|uniref:ABC transporter ATP-binding protein n=1 Tax=Butyrivibrio proteoclasticus TaxID=43305 RepID=UPI00047DCB06|nr:ABC transporter ATP-binding protein [Butyrivibrio proteoclasticus]